MQDIYNSWQTNKQKMPDGQVFAGDYLDFVETVDLLASEYGLGGCRSLEEYAEMVDETDPLLISCLMKAMYERYERQYGTDDNVDKNIDKINHGPSGQHSKPSAKKINRKSLMDASSDPKANRNRMANFLKVMGANKNEVNEAIKKIESGDIKVPSNDYSWINSKVLNDPEFDLQATLKQMAEDRKNSINFKVSLDTIMGKHG